MAAGLQEGVETFPNGAVEQMPSGFYKFKEVIIRNVLPHRKADTTQVEQSILQYLQQISPEITAVVIDSGSNVNWLYDTLIMRQDGKTRKGFFDSPHTLQSLELQIEPNCRGGANNSLTITLNAKTSPINGNYSEVDAIRPATIRISDGIAHITLARAGKGARTKVTQYTPETCWAGTAGGRQTHTNPPLYEQ